MYEINDVDEINTQCNNNNGLATLIIDSLKAREINTKAETSTEELIKMAKTCRSKVKEDLPEEIKELING